MSWHAVYRTADGALLSVGSVLADALPEGVEAREYEERPDQGAVAWDADARDFVAVPPRRPLWTVPEYVQRFTAAEWVSIVDDPRPEVRRLVHLTNVAKEIDPESPTVQGGLQYLEAVGLIAPGRAAEILGD